MVETIGRMRREHAVKRKPIRQISRAPRLSQDTVCKILCSKPTAPVYQHTVQPRRRLGR